MGDNTLDAIRSPRALVCHREVNGETGGATIHCVVLADGFILDCGTGAGEGRAKLLAAAVNAFGPEKFLEPWKAANGG